MLAFDFAGLMLVAAIASVLRVGSCVTGGALDQTLLAMIQREGVVGEGRGLPGLGAVAAFALQAKQPEVDLRLRMAGGTIGGGALVNPVDVAGRTFCRGVRAIEHEKLIVIEIGHAPGAIVAAQTIGAKLNGMLCHENGFGMGVASTAKFVGEAQLMVCLRGVAGLANHQGAIVVLAVVFQAEPGLGKMLERLACPGGGVPVCSGVAGGTFGAE